MIRELGEDYTKKLRLLFEGRVVGSADFVVYWFEKARAQIEQGNCQLAGLVSTNSIRGGKNQQVLSRIIGTNIHQQEQTNGNSNIRHIGINQSIEAERFQCGTSRGSSKSNNQSTGQADHRRSVRKASVSNQVRYSCDEVDVSSNIRTNDVDRQQDSIPSLTIFNAWADEPWVNAGAAVRVSLVCFDNTNR